MTENGNPDFLLEHLAEGKGDAIGDATGSDRGNGLAGGISSGHFDAFGDHDKAEALAAKLGARTTSQIASNLKGISGTRMMCAPPPIPS